MKVRELFIDEKCNGCEVCTEEYSTLFKIGSGGKAEVLVSSPLDDSQEVDAGFAIEKCPVGAIWGRGEGEPPGIRQE